MCVTFKYPKCSWDPVCYIWLDSRGSLTKSLCQHWRMKDEGRSCLFVCLFVCLLACLLVCLFVCLLACLLACLQKPCRATVFRALHPLEHSHKNIHFACPLQNPQDLDICTYRSVSHCSVLYPPVPTLCGDMQLQQFWENQSNQMVSCSHGEWSRELTLLKPAITRDLCRCDSSCLQLWNMIVNQLVFDFSRHKNAKDSVHVNSIIFLDAKRPRAKECGHSEACLKLQCVLIPLSWLRNESQSNLDSRTQLANGSLYYV